MNELPKASDFVNTPDKKFISGKIWGLFVLLSFLIFYPLFSVAYLKSTNGWVFISPNIYIAGCVCSFIFSAVLVLLMFRQGSKRVGNVLIAFFITFPVLLLILFSLFFVVPLRLVHTFLPKQEVIQQLEIEWITGCGGRRASHGWKGVRFVEGFGFLNENNCKLPSWLVKNLREGDELSWHVERSVVGFSLVKLERVSRNGVIVIDASWRGVLRD